MSSKNKILKVTAILAVIAVVGGLFYLEESYFGWFIGRGFKSSSNREADMAKFRKNMSDTTTKNIQPAANSSDLKKLVKSYLKEKDPAYLQGISNVKNNDLIEQLCGYAKQGVRGEEPYLNIPLQVSAITALGDLKDPNAAGCLEDLLKDKNEMISCNASIALGKIGVKESLKKIIENIDTSRCVMMGVSGFGKEGLEAILAGINDPNLPQIKKDALIAQIANIKDPVAKPILRKLVKSDNYLIETYAADSLLHMISPDDFEFWLGILKDESSDEYLQGHALLAMRAINNPQAVNVITKVYDKTPKLNRGTSNLNWEWAFSALAKMKKSEFCPEILKTLNENHSELKIAALNVIHYCPSDVVITNVKNTLNTIDSTQLDNSVGFDPKSILSQKNDVKRKAVSALYNSNTPESIKLLIELTNSNDIEISKTSLGKLGMLAKKSPELKVQFKDIFINRLDATNPMAIRSTAFNVFYDLYKYSDYDVIIRYKDDPYLGQSVRQIMHVRNITNSREEK